MTTPPITGEIEALAKEAREYLETMKAHTHCCGTTVIRKLVDALDRDSGDGVRAALVNLLAVVEAIQRNNPALFIPSLNFNAHVVAARAALSALSIPRVGVRLKIDAAPMIDGLRRLASHLHNLDSGSGEAKLIWAAADEIEALQRQALPPAGGWRPWDTAPKDGTWIIALCNDRQSIMRLSWGKDRSGVLSWCSTTGSYGCGDGLFATRGGWIPHPAPPASDKETI